MSPPSSSTALAAPVPAEALLAEARALKDAPAQEVLAWVEQRFGARAALASSFGVEDMVLIDLARHHAPSLRIFTLDTGRLPPETYELIEVVRNRYGATVETFFPERARVEALESSQGYFSFRKSLEARKECCAIRKVEPLRRALAGREAWLTGLRREQSVNRAAVEVAELDREHGGLIKLNPLAAWTRQDVWSYVKANAVPYNSLHDRGYPSIGCAPCTRAVKPYEDERAGRWWWESREHSECGLHPVR
ncbi:phosphoadenylyl-sulfate reductase [Pyxidicoccus fallax]|uniref:Adenosine 5'-phosphosulfate reductase n=1 Tax=Pyxidicoccus fallax TaxID=394095 RepID=A0A848L4U9_9BACT|nr:phosphoadenylyl-sulfate reductase [Pyxidicoccus fallax]NMO13487.1 phosphoadenylyl-sulfate reductase [Pyxidicoccus fallax]NPC78475.1 phosphoadenylyl-sulfate reductase [Pyxidicoccus fallax]